MLERHVFLIGMSGCGKSSLGRKVAANLHLRYTDMDRRIAEAAGCATTSDTYARWGEEGFRNAETNLLIELSREEPALVSTGGETVIFPQNREIMRSFGIIVLVDRPLNQILGDIKLDDRRPMLMDKGLDEVERLYNERIGIYRDAADIVLDNSHGYFAGVNALERLLRQRFRLT
ncbi:MAG: shikimate kinase [Clostridia bacterium]|nr:shikimate kinase [Clostridia bacterium]